MCVWYYGKQAWCSINCLPVSVCECVWNAFIGFCPAPITVTITTTINNKI